MRNLFLILLLVLCLSPASFAGAYAPPDFDDVLAKPEPAPQIITNTIVQKPEPIKPAEGLAIGCEGFYPTLSFSKNDWTMSAGYTSRSGNQSVLVSARGDFYAKDSTKLHAGLSLYPGSDLGAGVFVGLQQFITDKVSIGADLYAIRFGSIPAVIGDAVVVGRLYL